MRRMFALVLSVALLLPALAVAAPVVTPNNATVVALAYDPVVAGRVYASIEGEDAVETFRSNDFGRTWAKIPVAADVLEAQGGSGLFAISGRNLYRSTDAGATFRRSLAIGGDAEAIATEVSVDRAAPQRIWAGTLDPDGGRVYRTTNGGSNWAYSRPTTEPSVVARVIPQPNGPRVLAAVQALEVTPAAGTSNVYVSTNGGATWTGSTGLADEDVDDLAIDPTDALVGAAVSGEDLYVTTDGGMSWAKEFTAAFPLYSVAIAPSGEVIAAGGDVETSTPTGGVYRGEIGEGFTLAARTAPVFGMRLDARGALAHLATLDGYRQVWTGVTQRLSGANRYATAIRVSKEMFPVTGSADNVVITSGFQFADAVASTPLARAKGGTILYAGPTGLPAVTKNEIVRSLGATGTVWIVGGTKSLPSTIDSSLKSAGYTVVRVAGKDRVDLSVQIAKRLPSPTSAYVANGYAFADALSASAPAGRDLAPILFTGATLPASVSAYLDAKPSIQRVFALGGLASVTDTAVAQVDKLVPEVERIAGRDRYEVSLNLAKRLFPTFDAAGIAWGGDFPDALAGSPLCAANGAPLLLTSSATLPAGTRSLLAAQKPDVVWLFGGGDNLRESVRYSVESAW